MNSIEDLGDNNIERKTKTKWTIPQEIPHEYAKVVEVAEHTLSDIATYMFEKNITVKTIFSEHIFDMKIEDIYKEFVTKEIFLQKINKFLGDKREVEALCVCRLLERKGEHA
jgi:hypothetical protein